MEWNRWDKFFRAALREDIGRGDVTCRYVVPPRQKGKAVIKAKAEGIICGLPIAKRLYNLLEKKITVKELKEEGGSVFPGDIVAEITGRLQSIITGERTVLNFLQHLSGIATFTGRYEKALRPYGAKVYDTRKTTPVWRGLEKYAVEMGGGCNYRFGLFDMIMIKDNHIDAVGSIEEAIQRVIKKNRRNLSIVVEARTIEELEKALRFPVQVIMLDNMNDALIKKALRLTKGAQCEIEVSGGITLQRAVQLARLGVKRFSVGALTHSAPALDLSLKLVQG